MSSLEELEARWDQERAAGRQMLNDIERIHTETYNAMLQDKLEPAPAPAPPAPPPPMPDGPKQVTNPSLPAVGDKKCRTCDAIRAQMPRCSGCKRAHYCNRKCQKRDWRRVHKFACSYERSLQV